MDPSFDFHIIDFYPETGTLEVFVEELGLSMTVDVPIENDRFLIGDNLHRYISGIIPQFAIMRKRQLKNVQNQSDMLQYVNVEKRKESKAAAARAIRHKALLECDWVMMPDAGFSEKQVETFKKYRQQLRDVPQQIGFPEHIVWPQCEGEWVNHPGVKEPNELED